MFGRLPLVAIAVVSITLVAGGQGNTDVRTYDVTIPDEWKSLLSAGKLSVIGSPFYGARYPGFGLSPLVRINWSLNNLTPDPLCVEVDYRSKTTLGKPKTGFGRIFYVLAPKEERVIDDIVPVFSAKTPVRFSIRMETVWRRHTEPPPSAKHTLVTTDPLSASGGPDKDIFKSGITQDHFAIRSVELTYSEEEGNALRIDVRNETDKEIPLGILVAVADPELGKDGPVFSAHFRQHQTNVPASSEAKICLPYSVPPTGPNPMLAFTLFEPWGDSMPATSYNDPYRGEPLRNIRPIYWGSFDLRQAAASGNCLLPKFVPAEERAYLTEAKRSKHFLFVYRPGSYVEQNLPAIIQEQEKAYDELRSVLGIDLPYMIVIELYPDMEAKGIGSGSRSSYANTASASRFCEVYNENLKGAPYHELAHIFSQWFCLSTPGKTEGGSAYGAYGLTEGFAGYFERGRDIQRPKEAARKALETNQLSPLAEILLSQKTTEPIPALVDFLLKKDVEKFKEFYIDVTNAKGDQDLQKASKEIYGKTLGELEEEWHEYLKAPGGIGNYLIALPFFAAFVCFKTSRFESRNPLAWLLPSKITSLR